jgi:hypothetical protein
VSDFEFDPYAVETVRVKEIPEAILQGVKAARKRARAEGDLIPMVRLIGERGGSLVIVPARSFSDSRRIERLYHRWFEKMLGKLTSRR